MLAEKIKNIFAFIKRQINTSQLNGITLFIVLFFAFILKIFVVYFSYKNLSPFSYCISHITSDIVVLLVVQCIVLINHWIDNRKIRLIGDFLIICILILFCIDIFSFYYFQSRITIFDISRFISTEWGSFTGIGIFRFVILLLVIFGIFIVEELITRKLKNLKSKNLIFNSCLLIVYSIFYISILYGNTQIAYVDNVLTLNLKSISGTDFDIFNEDVSYEDYIVETTGKGKNLNVILIFAESLSAINSSNVGGHNNMPKFDEIQNNGITFTNFITNGTTSDTAHIATLLGVNPLINIGRYSTPYSGYKLLMPTLPEYLNSQGYQTTFISAVSLDFLKQREFLSGAGFQKIIGEEAFESKEKYTFESAPDGDLYDKVLDEVQSQTGKYFIGLQTISFHKPYITPYGKTEDLALKYSDDELFEFYQNLQEIGFFDNGILIIVGDHRMMNPAEEGEYEILGDNRYTKSVATVVGSGIMPGTKNSNIIQHTDFYNSIKKLLGSGNLQIDKTYNDIFDSHIHRNRGITNAEVYENNRYAVSFLDRDTQLFRSLSTLEKINSEIYKYFSSYVNFELGNDEDSDDENSEIQVIGHRGAPNQAPENTLESFLAAKSLGANGIEFDVSYTKDHQNIVVHGPEMYASNCYNEKVKDHDLDWITENCTIKNGEKYMTLAEMLGLIDGLFDYYFLEIKVNDESLGEQQAIEAIQTVKSLNMQDKVIFISYSDSARKVFNSDNDIIFGWDTRDVSDLDFIGDNNSKYFLTSYELLTPEIVQKASLMGKEVATYTVNNTGELQKIKDLGITYLMTDSLIEMNGYLNSLLE